MTTTAKLRVPMDLREFVLDNLDQYPGLTHNGVLRMSNRAGGWEAYISSALQIPPGAARVRLRTIVADYHRQSVH